ncbi:hypothetical protein [Deinococcus xianganensis]|uniref:Bacteriophage SP-beta YorD domain-containing protein n=1 Tax=Deinococcus xianganensis TaxID=1507289 RepID=A0A6I4YT84_9DEIO|nr:hypothetical protein [Deinococcus xianganensis]MXV20303.1 hypothetical protein [Deinococcus xianganensis]
MNHRERLTALLHLYPAAHLPEDVAFSDDGTGPVLTHWGLPGEPPTEAQLLAALPGAQALAAARQDLRDTQDMLDERYRLYNRAGATGNLVAQTEIRVEIDDLLTYMKELRDAPNPA